MARDRGRRARRADVESPVDQLEVWRDWRHDTAEFPPVAEPLVEDGRPPRRRKPRVGILLGAALLLAALALSGLTALGVGPVARLMSSSGSDEAPPSTAGTSATTTPSTAGSTSIATTQPATPSDSSTAGTAGTVPGPGTGAGPEPPAGHGPPARPGPPQHPARGPGN